MIQLACECGSGIKLTAIDEENDPNVLRLIGEFKRLHHQHELVTPFEATEIRHAERKRRAS